MASPTEEIRRQLEESARVKQSFSAELIGRIAEFAEKSAGALRGGGKLVFFGNGGSTNPSVLTAAGNDYGFERIFSRQIESLVAKNDILVALSTSGNSTNVLRGVEAGRARGAYLVAFTGETGGHLRGKVDLLLNVPAHDAQRIQECHITIGHIACSLIERLACG